jgi:hypothetical protein
MMILLGFQDLRLEYLLMVCMIMRKLSNTHLEFATLKILEAQFVRL